MPTFRKFAYFFLSFTLPLCLNGQTYFIQNINVINVESGKINTNYDVIIGNGKIKKIGPELPKNEFPIDNIIDGTDKFLIPGLFDMHAHLGPNSWLKMYLHYGVTGVRIMAGSDYLLNLKDSLSFVIQPNPSLYISSSLIDGTPPLWGDQHTGPIIENDTEINPLLDNFVNKGYKELKIYNRIPPEKYLQILDYAQKNNLRVSGHIPYNLPQQNFPDPRHHSIEHLDGFVQFAKQNAFKWNSLGEEEIQRTSLYKDLTIEDFEEVSNRIKSNGIWICPTLSLYGNLGNERIKVQVTQNKFKEELIGIFGFWRTLERLKEEFLLKYTIHSNILTAYFLDYSDRILAGTDSPNPYNPPGQALHFELIHLSKAGFSNAQILKIATLNAAYYLNLESELGTIEEGKIADMVLLNQNPLEDIQATQNIYQVFKNGKLVYD
ncbi:amidohydrolase family protein [Belliella sp. DSM 111904]|uniref:Amidohydrolase family protein n=1 Tax=Belliella filtrata TaxID=2923435 RepID=A0ABS9V4I4_9BACT|nr:amidohydrolase family protein [Belliella filtrata]MCH7411317.1 amidohydrolase family protein [Belliella filtrata]